MYSHFEILLKLKMKISQVSNTFDFFELMKIGENKFDRIFPSPGALIYF